MSRTSEARALRGFALMDPAKLREVSSKAGKASQATGKANRFRKGGNASVAGRRGGIASGKIRTAKKKAAPREHDQPGTPPALAGSGTVAHE